jgi:hypothetical protein
MNKNSKVSKRMGIQVLKIKSEGARFLSSWNPKHVSTKAFGAF